MSPEPKGYIGPEMPPPVIFNVKQVNRLPGGHRPFNTSTILSQLMLRKGVRVAHVMIATGVHMRMMSEYLARRKKPSPKSLNALARYFHVDPRQLIDETGFLALASNVVKPDELPNRVSGEGPKRVRGYGLQD